MDIKGTAQRAALRTGEAIKTRLDTTGKEEAEGEFPSLQARVLTMVGTTLIGSPAALGMPEATDWYYAPPDRAMPTPEEGDDYKKMRLRVYHDEMRFEVAKRFAKIALFINVVLAGIFLVLSVGGLIVVSYQEYAAKEKRDKARDEVMNRDLGPTPPSAAEIMRKYGLTPPPR